MHAAMLVGSSLVLAGCGESEEPAGRPAAATHTPPPALESAARSAPPTPQSLPPTTREWLELGDSTPPQTWLAARATGPDGPDRPAVEARLQQLLKEADSVFHETPRMLANRTVQLQRMLADISIVEAPQEILQGFIPLGQRGRPAGYADLCQHYFNLRNTGFDRAAALRALASSSGHDGGGLRGTP